MIQLSALLPIIIACTACAITVSWDTMYDDGSYSLWNTTCSDGPNGLITATRNILGDFPSFPYIGGAQYIEDWNSNLCGSCYQLTYNGSGIYMIAVDGSSEGFTTSQYAFNQLSGGRALEYGTIDADYSQVDSYYCGL